MTIVGRYRVEDQVDSDSLEKYAGLRVHGVPGVHAELLNILKTKLPAGAVLDLACGAGALSRRLADAGYQVTACDFIPDKLQYRDGVDFVEANLNEDFYHRFNRSFDCVIASEIIEHLENPRHFLRQTRLLLKPTGFLILSTPNIESPLSKAMFCQSGVYRWFAANDYTESGHITPLSSTCLNQALTETGFAVEKMTSAGTASAEGWWKMSLLASLIGYLSNGERGDVLIAVASP
jgi:2-polyprenyl-3-methyl-5-hydroxy-6-metoxy-1,4-benzoquinol methylase